MGFAERIDGNEPSIVSEEDNRVVYITNYGSVDVRLDTGELEFACMSIDRDRKYRWLAVKIVDGEFCVWVNRLGGTISESCYSSKFPYEKGNGGLSPAEVFRSLAADENFSQAGIITKKTLVQLMMKRLNLNKEDKQELKELFSLWRKPIVLSRQPIKGE